MSKNKQQIFKKRRNDAISKSIIFVFALSGIALLILMFSMILKEAFPAYKTYGLAHMYLTADFSEEGGYGILGGLIITLVTSILAVLISLPIASRVAIFVKYRMKHGKKFTQSLINVLAGVPSVIFGVFALKTFGSVTHVFGYEANTTILNATLILTIMIFPTMTAMILNQLNLVSEDLINSSIALGNTKTHSIYKVAKRSIRSGIIVSSIVALGRAIGETMALSMILTTSPSAAPFAAGMHEFFGSSSASLGVMIARMMFSDSSNPDTRAALFAAGIALFVVVMILVMGANVLSKKKIIANQNPFKTSEIYSQDKYPTKFIYHSILVFHYLTLPLRFIRFILFAFWDKLVRGAKYVATFIASPLNYLLYPKHHTSHQDLYVKTSKYRPHRTGDITRLILEVLAFAVVIGSIVWIIVDVFSVGIPAWEANMWKFTYQEQDDLFGTVTKPGIIMNTMVFTLILIGMSIAFAIPFALGTALYLSEYAQNRKLGKAIRFFLDSLGGTPSILFGIFGVIMFRQTLGLGINGGFSLLAGVLTMTIVILPTFTRSIEQVLVKVPQELRDASFALGASKFETIRKIVIPHAFPGIITGIILSAGRVISETAPVYLTIGMMGNTSIALNGEGWTMTTKILYNQIWATDNYQDMIRQSYAIASAAIMMVAGLIALAESVEFISRLKRKAIFKPRKRIVKDSRRRAHAN